MNILVVGNRIPVPPRDGGALAVFQMLEMLSNTGHQVTFASLNTSRQFVKEKDALQAMPFLNKLILFNVDTGIKAIPAIKNLFFSNHSYNLSRFIQPEFTKLIVEEIHSEKYDLIQFEGLFAAADIIELKKKTSLPVIIRTHNVEHIIWEKLAANSSGMKRFYLKTMSGRLKREEKNILNLATGFAHISPKDDLFFKTWFPEKHSAVIPYGISHDKIKKTAKKPFSICHIGSLEWMPNKDGVVWFIEKVWPLIQSEMPDTVFHLAGKNMPESFYAYQNDHLRVYGEVADADAFVSDKQILIVPVFSGSGIRIKTLESIALHTVVVSTSVGADGLNLEPEKEILIADTPELFAKSIIRLFQSQELINNIQSAGLEKLKSLYLTSTISDRLTSFYKKIISG